MEINRLVLPKNVTRTYTEPVDFSDEKFNAYYIRKIDHVTATAGCTQYEDVLRVTLHVEADVTAVCAYSLEDVPLHVKADDELDFTDEEEEGTFTEKGDLLNLDPYILTLILSRVPSKVVKKGKKLPDDGNGYRVLSEEEYRKEAMEKKTDHRWDALDDLDL